MSGENDLIKLYSGRILELAAGIPLTDRLPTPDATVKKRSPLCGSTVTVDLVMRDGVVVEFGQDVKACALGQAAASVVGSAIIGCREDQILSARDALLTLLKEDGPTPDAPFDDFEILRPAASYKNRHASIMLAIEATSEAIALAKEKQSA